MPFVNISLARGKSGEYLEAVSRAVQDALVAELQMKPEDEFQLIHQHEPGEMVFNRNFRGGPRSDDWIVFTITDGLERGEQAKRAFYPTLVRMLEEGPGVRPADVFVVMTVTAPENFSFADGVTGTDVAAAEALDAAAKDPGSRETYTKAEMVYAITELLGHRDSSRILPMLRPDFALKIPATLPYGGEFTGTEAFADFFRGTPGGAAVWESFDVHVDQVIESADYLVAQLTNTAVLKGTGQTVVFQNLWLFEVSGGRLVSAQLYADTAAVRTGAGGSASSAPQAARTRSHRAGPARTARTGLGSARGSQRRDARDRAADEARRDAYGAPLRARPAAPLVRAGSQRGAGRAGRARIQDPDRRCRRQADGGGGAGGGRAGPEGAGCRRRREEGSAGRSGRRRAGDRLRDRRDHLARPPQAAAGSRGRLCAGTRHRILQRRPARSESRAGPGPPGRVRGRPGRADRPILARQAPGPPVSLPDAVRA